MKTFFIVMGLVTVYCVFTILWGVGWQTMIDLGLTVNMLYAFIFGGVFGWWAKGKDIEDKKG